MKQVIERNTVQRMGVQSEGTFRIKATGKAFRILSDGLYSDKITAIIRELSCNAYDAHVAAGTLDKPFTLHLPTTFEPFFSLRDYGIGLSHEDVMQVYTTYFESTKTESNDFIGCLGLGSKSPYSYVDNFTIVSFFNGEKRTYSAFMNEDSIPSIALMAEENTDEPNGVEVSFAVNTHDFNSFSSRIPNVFRYFQLHPEITGKTDVSISPVEYGLMGDGWGIRKNDDGYRESGARAIMGNISYPLSDLDSDKVTENEWSLIRSNIDIRFDIGELEVAASRENISFNKYTIANIQKRLGMLVKEVSEKVSNELDSCPTLWDARLRAIELSNGTYAGLKSIFKLKDITYKGQEVHDGISTSIVAIPMDLSKEIEIDLFHVTTKSYRRRRYNSYDDNNEVVTKVEQPNGIMVKPNGIRFFIKDIDVGSNVRCKQVINDSEGTIGNVYLLNGKGTDAVSRLMELLGYEGEIEPISSIERVRAKRGSSANNPKNSKKILVYQTDSSYHVSRDKSSYWTNDQVDIEAGGIYVNMDRYKIGGNDADTYIDPILEGLKGIGEDVSKLAIIGVKSALWNDFDNNPKWSTLRAYAHHKMEEYIAVNNMKEHIINARAYTDSFRYSSTRIGAFLMEHYESLDSGIGSKMSDFVEFAKNWKESEVKSNDLLKLCSKVGYNVSHEEIIDEVSRIKDIFNSKMEEITNVYPMIKIVANCYNYDIDIVKDYIALVNKAREIEDSQK